MHIGLASYKCKNKDVIFHNDIRCCTDDGPLWRYALRIQVL